MLLLLLPAAGARAQVASEAQEEAPSTFAAELGAGIGAGQREAQVPTAAGVRRVSGDPFPAFDLGVRADALVSERVLFGARFRYQTSVGLMGEEQPAGGASRRTPLRSHRVEAGVVPALRFGTSSRSVALGLLAGWAVRGLRAVVDVTVPPYTLHGPLFRVELRVPIGDALTLRFAPELIALIGVSDELQRAAAVNDTGLALGGEASVRVRLAQAFALEASYRASRASLPTRSGRSLTDIEQFGTVQAVIEY